MTHILIATLILVGAAQPQVKTEKAGKKVPTDDWLEQIKALKPAWDEKNRLLGEQVADARTANEQYELLHGVEGFDLLMWTGLNSNVETSVRTAVELRLRELSLPLMESRTYEEIRERSKETKELMERLKRGESVPRPEKGGFASKHTDYKLVLTVAVIPVNDCGMVCNSTLALVRDGTVEGASHYWEVSVRVWETQRNLVLSGSDLTTAEFRIRDHVVQQIDKFANDYLKANPKEPKTPAKPKDE